MFRNILKRLSIQKAALLSSNDTLVQCQPTRNTFVLKRKWPPGLHKKNQPSHKLRARNNVYELVEDTMIRPKPNLEVVLTAYVEGIGDKGQVVSLKPTIAYNRLLLPGLAVYKTEENIKKYAKSESEKTEITHSSPFAQRTVNMLNSLTLAVIMNKDQPWTIEPWHIKASLRKVGYYAPEEAITLPSEPISGPDMRKQNKEFEVIITVNNFEKAVVKCRIHHWSTDPSERLPYVYQHWKETSEPLFGEKLNSDKVQ